MKPAAPPPRPVPAASRWTTAAHEAQSTGLFQGLGPQVSAEHVQHEDALVVVAHARHHDIKASACRYVVHKSCTGLHAHLRGRQERSVLARSTVIKQKIDVEVRMAVTGRKRELGRREHRDGEQGISGAVPDEIGKVDIRSTGGVATSDELVATLVTHFSAAQVLAENAEFEKPSFSL